jgi:hypothetical protein
MFMVLVLIAFSRLKRCHIGVRRSEAYFVAMFAFAHGFAASIEETEL